jgi:hypothetical protein
VAQAFQDAGLLRDAWQARDEYIEVVLDRSPGNVDRFLEHWLAGEPEAKRQVQALKALELQRHAMLMYTSCGWFFDEISGLESTQVLLYAARVLQLARECFGLDLEKQFLQRLRQAPSNLPEYRDGGGVYEAFIRPAAVDLLRVGVHYAVSSLFEEYAEDSSIYCYSVHSSAGQRDTAGKMSLSTGRVKLASDITREQGELSFAALHLGGPIINAAVRFFAGEREFGELQGRIRETFRRSDIPEVIRLMDEHFGTHNYSIWHLFRDERRAFFARILASTLEGIRLQYRSIYQENYPILQAMKETGVPIPAALRTPLEFTLNQDLAETLAGEAPAAARLQEVLAEMRKWGLSPEASAYGLAASRLARRLLEELAEEPQDHERWERALEMLEILRSAGSPLNLWEAQNQYFRISQQLLAESSARAEAGDQEAVAWLEGFRRLGLLLEVTVAG